MGNGHAAYAALAQATPFRGERENTPPARAEPLGFRTYPELGG